MRPVRGVAAAAPGTLAMDASLYRRYRHDGGSAAFPGWESSEGLVSWENAPGPALAAKVLLEGVFRREISPRYARLLNNVTHWGFGLAAGAAIRAPHRLAAQGEGVVRTPVRRRGLGQRIRRAPELGVYKPIWKYDLETLAKDLSAHLVFGTATAAAYSILTNLEARPMTSTESATRDRSTATADLKLEVVVIPVADADRSKDFYKKLGWRLDADFAFDNGFRVVQFTPPGSGASIQFGSKITSAPPGSGLGLYLIVSDIQVAHDELAGLGVAISDVFHAGAPGAQFQRDGADRVSGLAPEHATYGSFATFSDPDGNEWLLQEVTERLPGRVDASETTFASTADLANAMRRASIAHGEHEKREGGEYDVNWPEWYAAYMVAEQAGTELPT